MLYLDEFALQQYSLALKHLLKPFSRREKQAVDICLVACVLFACFEVRILYILISYCLVSSLVLTPY